MDKVCSTCKFWAKKFDDEDKFYCSLAESERGDKVVVSSKAVAIDGESWCAYLETEPDFGCNQWQEKPIEINPDLWYRLKASGEKSEEISKITENMQRLGKKFAELVNNKQ